jgi:hypothetical protein
MKKRVVISSAVIGGLGLIVTAILSGTPVLALQQVEPFVDHACLDCHTDRSLLTELAVEEVVVEALSEGPG